MHNRFATPILLSFLCLFALCIPRPLLAQAQNDGQQQQASQNSAQKQGVTQTSAQTQTQTQFQAQDKDQGQDQDQDSVAAAARKARQEKKSPSTPSKVFTNDNIPTTPSHLSVVGKDDSQESPNPADNPENTASNSSSGSEAAAGPGGAEEKSDANDEAHWRARFAKLRDKLSRAQAEADVMQRELNNLNLQYYPDPTTALIQSVTRSDINKKTAQLKAKQDEIAQLKQQISDLEDDLRKSGGDPGWAR